MTTTKTCNQCKEEQDIALFGKNKSTLDGFKNKCKKCERGNREEKLGRKTKKNVTTLHEANAWLSENYPRYKVLEWGGRGQDVSIILDQQRDVEFSYSFMRFRDKLSQNPDRIFSGTKEEKTDKIKETFQAKYGKSCALQVPEFKRKQEESTKLKFGTSNVMQNEKFVRENICGIFEGKTKSEWAQELNVSYSHFVNVLNSQGLDIAKGLKERSTNLESEISEILKDLNIEFVFNKWNKELGKRPDFVLPKYNLIIEANGLRWHSEEFLKGRNFHMERRKQFELGGFFPLFFLGNEILEKKKIIRSIILNKIDKSTKIGARKCDILIPESNIAKNFFEENHLMGNGTGRSYGLIYNKEIVAVLQVRNRKEGLEISRFCTKNEMSITGGFSKLLKKVKEIESPKTIYTFIDRRYGKGDYLNSMGFKKMTEHPSFSWTDGKKVHHRFKFLNDKKANSLGFSKIWDCGQAKYVLNLG